MTELTKYQQFQVKLFLLQVDGLSKGYHLSKESPQWSSLRYSGRESTDLDPFGF